MWGGGRGEEEEGDFVEVDYKEDEEENRGVGLG